jgi:hypothetical protein
MRPPPGLRRLPGPARPILPIGVGLALLLRVAGAAGLEPTAAGPGGLAALPAPGPGPRPELLLEERALAAAGLEREASPAGRVVERIEIVREEVIAATDPWPSLLNALHATTRDGVVRQELLVQPGDRWSDPLVEESARNLRALSILALVRTVPCKGTRPDGVVLLVATRDLWSIRLNSQLTVVGSVLQLLDLQPSETNLLGQGKSLGLHLRGQQIDLSRFALRDKAAIGESYTDGRLFGSRLALAQSFDLLVAGALPCGGRTPDGTAWCTPRRPGQLDGFAGSLDLQRPLYSLATEWAFDLGGSVNSRQVRRMVVNSGPAPPGEVQGLGLDTVTFGSSTVPAVYDVLELSARGSATRSVGTEIKHDLSVGAGGYRHKYTPPGSFPFEAAALQAYASSSLPGSEDAAYAQVSYRLRDTRYVRLHGLQTFGHTEDYLLGPDVTLLLRAGANLGALRQSFGEASLRAQHRWYAGDDLLTLWLNAGARWQPHLDELGKPGPWANESLDLGATNAAPRFWGGRLFANLRLVLRRNALDQATSALGGDTGLRGYPSGAFVGSNLLQANAEWRSDPLELWSLQVGWVLFADGGSVFGEADPRSPARTLPFLWVQSVGLGLRALFPQFDKSPIRADLGVPLASGGGPGTWFSLAFQQVF